jgi:hypothetical protein
MLHAMIKFTPGVMGTPALLQPGGVQDVYEVTNGVPGSVVVASMQQGTC